MKRESLANQVMLPLVIATLCLGGVLLLVLPGQIEQQVRERSEIELESTGEAMSLAIRIAILEEDLVSLEQISQQLEAHPLISMAEVTLDTPQGPTFLAEFPYAIGFEEKIRSGGDRYRFIRKPFSGGELSGWISIAMDEHALEASIDRYKVPVYLVFVVFSLVQLLVFHLLRRRVLEPISRAADWARRLSFDESSAPLNQQISQDEIGDLQRSLLDLTERLAIEAGNNRALMNSLESAVDAKTRELETARRELDRAQRSEMVGRLAGGISHDFNNLLTAIEGNLRFAAGDAVPGTPLREAIDDATEAVHSGISLNARLLSFAESSRGHAESVPLYAFFDEFSRQAAEGVLPVKYHIAEDIRRAEVRVSPFELSSVLQALLQNAAEAMADSQGHIWVVASLLNPELDVGARVELVVHDEGAGMLPEVKAHCFDPFFSTKAMGAGRGLGLYQVLNFAESAGGGCDIRSEPGRGTSVRVWLPASIHRETAEGEPDSRATRAYRGQCLLVVDDDDRSRRALVRSLRPLGLEVVECNGAGEALARLASFKDRLRGVISDVVMPNGVDGFRLKRELQKVIPGVPVLLVSGFEFPATDNQDEVIRKPLQLSVIEQLLNSA